MQVPVYHVEQRGVSKETTFVGLTETAARPLIAEKYPEIKEKAVEKISKDLKGGQRVGRVSFQSPSQISNVIIWISFLQ